MKIVLDITKLLDEKKITKEEYSKLLEYSKKDSGSLALNILIAFGIIAIVGGLVGMSLNPVLGLATALITFMAGIYVNNEYGKDWGLLGKILMIMGVLGSVVSGYFILGDAFDQYYYYLVMIACLVSFGVGIYLRSGFLVGLSALLLSPLLNIDTSYGFMGSGSYGLSVEQPLNTIVVYSLFGFLAYYFSFTEKQYENILVVFTRVCVFMANLGFWVGSLYGDRLFGTNISEIYFSIAWALALLAFIYYGLQTNRRFVINIAAVFGSTTPCTMVR
jgi:hypothetical protein